MQKKLLLLSACAALVFVSGSTIQAQNMATKFLPSEIAAQTVPTTFQSALQQPIAVSQTVPWNVVVQTSETNPIYEIDPPQIVAQSQLWEGNVVISPPPQAVPAFPTAPSIAPITPFTPITPPAVPRQQPICLSGL